MIMFIIISIHSILKYVSYFLLFILWPFHSWFTVYIQQKVTRAVSLQVKAAFTRAYNKEVHLTPYSLQAVKKGRRGGGGGESELGGDDMDQNVQESEDEGENLKADAMIKVRAFKLWYQCANSNWCLLLSA